MGMYHLLVTRWPKQVQTQNMPSHGHRLLALEQTFVKEYESMMMEPSSSQPMNEAELKELGELQEIIHTKLVRLRVAVSQQFSEMILVNDYF